MFTPNRERLTQPSLGTERPGLSFLTGEWSGRGELEGFSSQPLQYECTLRVEAGTRPGEWLLTQHFSGLSAAQAEGHPAFWHSCRLETLSNDRYRISGVYGTQTYHLMGQLFLPASATHFRRLTFQEAGAATAPTGWTTINFFERQRQLRYVFENYDTRWHSSRFRLEARLVPVSA